MLLQGTFAIFLVACVGDKPSPSEDPETGGTDSAPDSGIETGSPTGEGAVVITNASTLTLGELWQCSDDGSCLIDGLFSLEPGNTYTLAVKPGVWWTVVIAPDKQCAASPAYTLADGDQYEWSVADLPGEWNSAEFDCQY